MRRVLFALVVFIFGSSCSSVFYYPSSEEVLDPKVLGLEYEDIYIEGTPRLHAWLLKTKNPIATVVHFHGNAENIGTHIAGVYWLPAYNVQVLTVDYRGYGRSEGVATLDGLNEDVARTLDFIFARPDVDPRKVILFGQSLGGAMALWAASQPRWKGRFPLIVADSAFSSYRAIAQEKLSAFWLTYPFQWPLRFLVSDAYAPIGVVKALVGKPVLLMHGTADEVVPVKHSRDLCSAIGPSCTLWEVSGAGHTQILKSMEYREKLVGLIRNATAL